MKNKSKSLPNQFEDRDVDIYTIKTMSSDVLKPERFVLKIESKLTPIDFGALCYVRRNRKENSELTDLAGSWTVDIASIENERKELIKGLIDQFIVAGIGEETIRSYHRGIVHFLDWADNNGHCKFLSSEVMATKCYREYIDDLYHQIATEKNISPMTANARQRDSIQTLKAFFGDSEAYITRNVAPISFSRTDTEAPESKRIRQYLDVVSTLSLQLSKQLVDNKPFPLFLQFKNYSTYLFHGNGRNIDTPYATNPFFVYDFEEGRIATQTEHLAKVKNKSISASKKSVSDAQSSLDECNRTRHHESKLTTISLCMQSYAALFQLITGANSGLIRKLESIDAAKIVNSSIKKELSTIKLRANGKTIRLPIGGKYGRQFLREYLVFRDSVLDGRSTKLLFFSIKRHSKGIDKPLELPDSFQSTYFHERLLGKYLPSDFINITPSLARIYKNVVLLELGTSHSVVSEVLGHTESVNVKHYTGISYDKQQGEFVKFWNSIKAASKEPSFSTPDSKCAKTIISTASGSCEDLGNPEPVADNVPIQPNCDAQYGCLFCKHYCCHADKEDIHKLHSLIYVLSEVRQQANNPDHADTLLRELCLRAKTIVDSISGISAAAKIMVDECEIEVFDRGILTHFWERRLTRYEQIGVVI